MARIQDLSVLLLLLLALLLPRLCIAQRSCRPAPMWLFVNPADVRHFISNIQDKLVLVTDGNPNSVLTIRELAFQTFSIFVQVQEVPLIWCIQGSEFQEIRYSINIASDNPMVMADPDLTIPHRGVITTIPYRFRLVFRCKASGSSSRAGMTASINLTSSQGEEFCPILFYFFKICSSNGSSLPLGELPTVLEAMNITDGFLNGVQFSFKTLTTPTIIIGNVVPDILKGVLIPFSIISLAMCISSVIAAWVVWRRRSQHKMCDIEDVGVAYRQVHQIRDGGNEKEFPLKNLVILWELGEGAFGIVSKAEAQGIVDGEEFSNVAVKQLRPGSNLTEDFFREVNFMISLDHPNIIRLLGVCSQEEPYSMIFEYMDLGDLCSFLRGTVDLGMDMDYNEEEDEIEPLLTRKELLHIVRQVAEGMVYISSKQLVHRDLATRNCLVSVGLVVKIADFGLSRNLEAFDYYKLKGPALLPIRWMSPESLLYGKFTVESDIWAFGVLMWEVFTLGQRPFSGLRNEEVITEITEGRYLEPPPKCPFKHLMLQCWKLNPRRRPRFEESLRDIEELYDKEGQ